MTLYTDIEPFCCEVLRARVADGGLPPGDVWERDVRTLTAEELKPYTQVHLFCGIGASPLGLKWAGWPDDSSIVTGGFPCQDLSVAGKGEGIGGARSGLWKEMHRVIDAVRPRWIIAENVPALRTRGIDRVLGDLEGIGYSGWAFVVGAGDLGAPIHRKRAWILARSGGNGQKARRRPGETTGREPRANATRAERAMHPAWPPRPSDVSEIPRAVDGLPDWVDPCSRNSAIDALGNAQVPQIVELIARSIMDAQRAGGGA